MSLSLVAALLVAGFSAYGSGFIKSLQDFYAPIVNNKTTLPNTVPAGTIIYEANTSGTPGFYGLASDGTTWVTLGTTATAAAHNSWSGYHDADCGDGPE